MGINPFHAMYKTSISLGIVNPSGMSLVSCLTGSLKNAPVPCQYVKSLLAFKDRNSTFLWKHIVKMPLLLKAAH